MSIRSDFIALSTTKKICILFFGALIVTLPFAALTSKEADDRRAAAYQAMTPEQRKAHDRRTFCTVEPVQCRNHQDALVEAHNTLKKAKNSGGAQ